MSRVPFVSQPARRLDDEELSFAEAAERVMRRQGISLRAVAMADRDAFRRLERERDALFDVLERQGFPVDPKGRLSGERLGPVTLSIVNAADDAPAERHFRENMLAIYAGFSPELESFCTLNLWPGISQSATIVFHEIPAVAKRPGALLRLGGKYQIEPPNALFPWFARDVAAVDADSRFYDWRYFPYAKRTGEELTRPPAPIACRRMHLRSRTGDVTPSYGELVTVAGAFVRVRGDLLTLAVPRVRPAEGWETVTIALGETTSRALCEQVGALRTSTAVVALIVRDHHGAGTVLQLEQTSDIGVLVHLLARELYARYIVAPGLRAASCAELDVLITQASHATERTLRRHVGRFDDRQRSLPLLMTNLSPFFELDDVGVLARPRVLAALSRAALSDADRTLAGGAGFFAPLDVIALRKAERRLLDQRDLSRA